MQKGPFRDDGIGSDDDQALGVVDAVIRSKEDPRERERLESTGREFEELIIAVIDAENAADGVSVGTVAASDPDTGLQMVGFDITCKVKY